MTNTAPEPEYIDDRPAGAAPVVVPIPGIWSRLWESLVREGRTTSKERLSRGRRERTTNGEASS